MPFLQETPCPWRCVPTSPALLPRGAAGEGTQKVPSPHPLQDPTSKPLLYTITPFIHTVTEAGDAFPGSTATEM